jgi:uracil-DNA glycosylase
MLIGEQPDDADDTAGHPFVGPAEKLLDRYLAEAGIDRVRTSLPTSSSVSNGSVSESRRSRRDSSLRWEQHQHRPCSEEHSMSPRIVVD